MNLKTLVLGLFMSVSTDPRETITLVLYFYWRCPFAFVVLTN